MAKNTYGILTDNEALTFGAAEFRPEATAKELSKITGLKESKTQYALHRLRQKGFLTRYAGVNFGPLGYRRVLTYLDIPVDKHDSLRQFFAAIRRQGLVVWAVALTGEFNFAFSCSVRDPMEVETVLQKCLEESGVVVGNKQLAINAIVYFFGRKYLYDGPYAEPVRFGTREIGSSVSLSTEDQRIFDALPFRPIDSAAALGRELGLPASTMKYKLKQFEELDLITGYYYRCNPQLLGAQAYRVMVQVRRKTEQIFKRLYAYCRSAPRVGSLVYTLGRWDFEVGMEAYDIAQVSAVATDIRKLLGAEVNSLTLLNVLSEPLAEEAPESENPLSRRE